MIWTSTRHWIQQQSWFIDNLKQREWQRWWQKKRRIFCRSPPLSPGLFLLLLPESHIDISNQCILTILIIWDLFARWFFFSQTRVINEPDIGHPSLCKWQQLTLPTIKSNLHERSIYTSNHVITLPQKVMDRAIVNVANYELHNKIKRHSVINCLAAKWWRKWWSIYRRNRIGIFQDIDQK